MLSYKVIDMIELISRFIEMRGISVISAILIGFLFKLDIDQRRQICELKKELGDAKECLEKKIEKYLEKNNTLMLDLKVEMGKMSESIKAICITLEDLKRDKRGR